MAASKPANRKIKIALRHEILSYKPGKAVPCDDDELVVFPDQLVIGVLNIVHASNPFIKQLFMYDIVPALRRALHGDAAQIKYADKRETSTEEQGSYLTDYISVIEMNPGLAQMLTRDFTVRVENDVKDLAAKVGCFVVLMTPGNERSREAIRKIKEITGRYPVVGLWNFSEEQVELVRQRMREEGIVEVYEIPVSNHSLFDTETLQLLRLLHGCLREGDAMLANDHLKELSRNPRYNLLYERAKKEITGAKQKMTEEIRPHERMEESLQQEMKKIKMKLEESSADWESLVNDNARRKNEIVREKEEREEAELALAEHDAAKNSQEMCKQTGAKLEKEIETEEQHINTQKENFKKTEETARREVERMKKEKEEEREKTEKEKLSLNIVAAQLKEEVESLTETVEENEQDKATLKQHVNRLETEKEEERARLIKEKLLVESALKYELKSEKERVKQLERETWKLRTKIQLESEIRSAELQKKKSETSQWSFFSWMSSGKQTHPGISLSEDPSRESSGKVEVGEEPPNDAFADILKQIADDLSDEAKIDSLGGQLGILQGDINRALKTNMRYEQITSRGTYLMLKQWRRGVSREDEWMELRRALEAAKLLNIADRYLPQEGSTGSTKKAEDLHLLSGGNGTASEQGSTEESPKHSIDDEQYSPEDIMTSGGESEVTGTDQPKLKDPHEQSGKDGPPSPQRSPRGQTEVEETRATIEQSSPCDIFYMTEEENDGVNQQSEESLNHSTTEDMPSGETFSEETSTSNENQIEYITTKFDDLVSSLVFSDSYLEKLYFLLFAKVIIDIR